MDNLLTFDTTDAMRLIKKSLQLHEQVLICYCRLPTNLLDLADEAFSLTEHSSPRTGQYHSFSQHDHLTLLQSAIQMFSFRSDLSASERRCCSVTVSRNNKKKV